MRNLKKLLMVPVLVLCTTLVACEQAGDLTGPSLQAPSSLHADRGRVAPQPTVAPALPETGPVDDGVEINSAYGVIIPD
jgi:hypothetical protein